MAVPETEHGLPKPAAPLSAGDHRSLPSRFDEHVARAPEHPAVADSARAWTYRELQARANQLAHWLIAKGVGKGQVVAVHAERNALTIWAMLGILKAEAAFMLLDADYPDKRIFSHIKVGKPTAWIDAAPGLAKASLAASRGLPEHRIALASCDDELRDLPTTSPVVEYRADQRAYVVFTSGTTGEPKAAAGSMAGLAHWVEWQVETFVFTADDRFSALSGLAHLPFTRDVFTPLSIGASIQVPAQELRREPDGLAAWLVQSRVSVVHLTPSLAEVLALARAGTTVPDLHTVFFGGEPLRAEAVDALRAIAVSARFVNLYGTSETPNPVSYYVVGEQKTGPLPIGRAVGRTQLLIIKDDETLAAVGEEGEICVRSPYLESAYLNGATGGFGVNPFTRDPADRVYRTNDRGMYLPDGSLQFLGRRDDQVKVRGYRVELREVEDAIQSQPGVTRAVVVLREQTRALVAYVTGEVDVAGVLAELRRRLPDYMVPTVIVPMARMPLTPNGKLDKSALPAPSTVARPVEAPTASAHDDSMSETETSIAEIFMDILDCDEVDRHDNFFDLGGHSLNATQVAMRIRDHFKVEVTVRMIFDAPTVAGLAKRVGGLSA